MAMSNSNTKPRASAKAALKASAKIAKPRARSASETVAKASRTVADVFIKADPLRRTEADWQKIEAAKPRSGKGAYLPWVLLDFVDGRDWTDMRSLERNLRQHQRAMLEFYRAISVEDDADKPGKLTKPYGDAEISSLARVLRGPHKSRRQIAAVGEYLELLNDNGADEWLQNGTVTEALLSGIVDIDRTESHPAEEGDPLLGLYWDFLEAEKNSIALPDADDDSEVARKLDQVTNEIEMTPATSMAGLAVKLIVVTNRGGFGPTPALLAEATRMITKAQFATSGIKVGSPLMDSRERKIAEATMAIDPSDVADDLYAMGREVQHKLHFLIADLEFGFKDGRGKVDGDSVTLTFDRDNVDATLWLAGEAWSKARDLVEVAESAQSRIWAIKEAVSGDGVLDHFEIVPVLSTPDELRKMGMSGAIASEFGVPANDRGVQSIGEIARRVVAEAEEGVKLRKKLAASVEGLSISQLRQIVPALEGNARIERQ